VRGDIKESEGEETNGIIIQFWVATTKNFFAPSVQIVLLTFRSVLGGN
jgi:hypothetical protein